MLQPNDQKITIFIDVDGTIIDYNDKVYDGAVETIKKLSERANIYIWSAGGYNYSMRVINRLRLEKHVCGALPKPNYTIDDLVLRLPFSRNIPPDWKFIDKIAQDLLGTIGDDLNII